MPAIIFKGRLYPAILKVELLTLPILRLAWPDDDMVVDFAVSINGSKVQVKCDASKFDKDRHLSVLAMHAHHLSSAAVDSACFCTGFGIAVHLESWIDGDGAERVMAQYTGMVSGLSTAFTITASNQDADGIQAMYSLVAQDRLLLLALNDLIMAISRYDLAAINCGRAIDALRTSISSPETTRDEGWALLRENLGLTREYLIFLSKESAGPRHGDRRAPHVGNQAEIIKRAWTIMNRFLEFRKRRNLPLPLDDFPLL